MSYYRRAIRLLSKALRLNLEDSSEGCQFALYLSGPGELWPFEEIGRLTSLLDLIVDIDDAAPNEHGEWELWMSSRRPVSDVQAALTEALDGWSFSLPVKLVDVSGEGEIEVKAWAGKQGMPS